MIYRQKTTGKRYRWLAVAIDKTPGRNDVLMAVYCPEDNGHVIYLLNKIDFDAQFALVDDESS